MFIIFLLVGKQEANYARHMFITWNKSIHVINNFEAYLKNSKN